MEAANRGASDGRLPGRFRNARREILTLAQTRKLDRRIPVLLYGARYWNEIVDFGALVRHGMIAREDTELFDFVDDPATALRLIQAEVAPGPEEAAPALAHSRTPDEP